MTEKGYKKAGTLGLVGTLEKKIKKRGPRTEGTGGKTASTLRLSREMNRRCQVIGAVEASVDWKTHRGTGHQIRRQKELKISSCKVRRAIPGSASPILLTLVLKQKKTHKRDVIEESNTLELPPTDEPL